MRPHFDKNDNNVKEPIDALKDDGYTLGDKPVAANFNWLFSKLMPSRLVDNLEEVADLSDPGQLFIDAQPPALPFIAAGLATLAGAVDQVACTSASVVVASFATAPNSVFEYSRDLTTLLRTYTMPLIALGAFEALATNGRYIVAGHGSTVTIWDREDPTGNPIAQTPVTGTVEDFAIAGSAVIVSHVTGGGANIRRITLSTGAIADSVIIGTSPKALAYDGRNKLIIADAAGGNITSHRPFTAGFPVLSSVAIGTRIDTPGTLHADHDVSIVGITAGTSGLAQELESYNVANTSATIGRTTAQAALSVITPDLVVSLTGSTLYLMNRRTGLTNDRVTLATAPTSMDTDGRYLYVNAGTQVVAYTLGIVEQRFARVDPTSNFNAYPLLLQPLGV